MRATENEAIRDGLRALQEREMAVEQWLRQDVAIAYDAITADPSRGRSLAEVRASLAAEHARATETS